MTRHEKSYEPVTFEGLEMESALAAAALGRTPLERLEHYHRLAVLVAAATAQEARTSFDRGASWAEVGAVLGVSKQAAWQRYGGPTGRAL